MLVEKYESPSEYQTELEQMDPYYSIVRNPCSNKSIIEFKMFYISHLFLIIYIQIQQQHGWKHFYHLIIQLMRSQFSAARQRWVLEMIKGTVSQKFTRFSFLRSVFEMFTSLRMRGRQKREVECWTYKTMFFPGFQTMVILNAFAGTKPSLDLCSKTGCRAL